ncbi:manganese efflux pump MntP family protein [Sphingomonas jaspsi]|uniref:manganese efflux pump MntP n=1 Tax=Sphingomonas jaspsi TaxID=392409 RepID=UPI0004B724A9|nr:manganese efflux pump MntP family protein [Sphingomonas jaspsi]
MLTTLSILALAIGLAMDAFAAALAQGAALRPGWRESLRVGVAFGVAQAVMPLIGWALGIAFAGVIQEVDHWIALVLLGFLGLRMIRAGLDSGEDVEVVRQLTNSALLSMAIATSIDAAVAGITLPLIDAPLWASIGAIGLVTFLLSTFGMHAGAAAGARLGKRAELLGGAVLILLGLKIFVSHQFLGG